MRVLVCGGRGFGDFVALCAALGRVVARYGRPEVVIHGGARGADRLAGLWAEYERVPTAVFAADWARHGRSAGPLRNRQMLEEGQPDLVVAFAGGRGTADMVRQAREWGVEVWRPEFEPA